jgi:hypothetical protein
LFISLLTVISAVAPPDVLGTSILCNFMMSAHNSRIIIAASNIYVLAPVVGTSTKQSINITLLLPESNGRCVGITQEGVLFVLDAPDCGSFISNCTSRPLTASTLPPSDGHTSIGRLCLPWTARNGQHTMHATAACLYNDSSASQKFTHGLQTSSSNQMVVIFFAPPPIISTAPIDLRVARAGRGRGIVQGASAQKSTGCLQAHGVENGRLVSVFEGCGDDISCVAESSGDKATRRYLLAGSDEEGGGLLLLWPLLDHGEMQTQNERQVPLLITVQVHKVYPSCGAVTSIIGRAADAIVAFAGGKIAIFSLISRSFKCGITNFQHLFISNKCNQQFNHSRDAVSAGSAPV